MEFTNSVNFDSNSTSEKVRCAKKDVTIRLKTL